MWADERIVVRASGFALLDISFCEPRFRLQHVLVGDVERNVILGFAVLPEAADSKASRDRVQLRYVEPETYDVGFYRDELLWVAESILSSMGWRDRDFEMYLRDHADASLLTY